MCTTSHSLCLALYSQKVYLWSSDLFVLLQIQDLDILNIALQAMEQDKLWTRYFESLMVSKFSLDSEDSSQSIKVLSDLFSDFQQLKIHRRVIELHAYIKYCGLDSKLLAVLRFVDSMYQRSRAMSDAVDKKGYRTIYSWWEALKLQIDAGCFASVRSLMIFVEQCFITVKDEDASKSLPRRHATAHMAWSEETMPLCSLQTSSNMQQDGSSRCKRNGKRQWQQLN